MQKNTNVLQPSDLSPLLPHSTMSFKNHFPTNAAQWAHSEYKHLRCSDHFKGSRRKQTCKATVEMFITGSPHPATTKTQKVILHVHVCPSMLFLFRLNFATFRIPASRLKVQTKTDSKCRLVDAGIQSWLAVMSPGSPTGCEWQQSC